MREPWMDDAACAEIGTDFFFPEEGVVPTAAKRICAGCPVAAECLKFGMGEDFGVWGGTTPVKRRKMRNAA